jgi:Ca-activated chloride channel family protein
MKRKQSIVALFAAFAVVATAQPPAPPAANPPAAGTLTPPPPSAPGATPEIPAEPRNSPADADIGFTWGNRLPAFVRRGNASYEQGEFENAEQDFQSAKLLDPSVPAPTFNLGLSAAKRGEQDTAVSYFENAADLARDDAALKGRALYNKGVVRFEQAKKALEEKKDTGAAINSAIEALDSFQQAETLATDLEDAAVNRALVQDFLRTLPVAPPPQEQPDQQKNDEQKQNDQQQSEQQQQQPQDQQQDQQEQQQNQQQNEQQQEGQGEPQEQDEKGGEQEKPAEPQPAEPKPGEEEQEAEGEPKEGEQPQDGKPREMTPEEARQLLNMLDKGEEVNLTKGKNPKADPKNKPW